LLIAKLNSAGSKGTSFTENSLLGKEIWWTFFPGTTLLRENGRKLQLFGLIFSGT
jgi:hypothetical protein